MVFAALPVAAVGQSDAAQSLETCPGLERYASKSHATEKSLRRRCELLDRIEQRGVIQPPALRERVLEDMAKRFYIEIDFTGEVDLPRRAIDFLLRHISDTALMVTSYSENRYLASQVDDQNGPVQFTVTNDRTFTARFVYLYSQQSPAGSEHMFFETGRAQVLFWTIWGNAFIHYQLLPAGNRASQYDIKVHVFMDSRLLRTILKSGLFHFFANRMFRDILDDIESSALKLAGDAAPDDGLRPAFVQGLNDRLRTPAP